MPNKGVLPNKTQMFGAFWAAQPVPKKQFKANYEPFEGSYSMYVYKGIFFFSKIGFRTKKLDSITSVTKSGFGRKLVFLLYPFQLMSMSY